MATKKTDLQKAIDALETFKDAYPEDTIKSSTVKMLCAHCIGSLSDLSRMIQEDVKVQPFEEVVLETVDTTKTPDTYDTVIANVEPE